MVGLERATVGQDRGHVLEDDPGLGVVRHLCDQLLQPSGAEDAPDELVVGRGAQAVESIAHAS